MGRLSQYPVAGSCEKVLCPAGLKIFLYAILLGQGVPFLLVGFLVDRAGPFLRRVGRYTHLFSVIGGVTLILIGFFALTGLFSGS
jgi:cytochrome c biogenesis protein CcdA